MSTDKVKTTSGKIENIGGYEAEQKWGGRSLSGDISPIDAGISNKFSANRLAFSKPSCIIIEYSNDNGKTWKDYPTTDDRKVSLVSGITAWNFAYGNHNSKNTAKDGDALRITIKSTGSFYTLAKKLYINFSTNGSKGTRVLVENAKNTANNPVYKTIGTFDISGWSAWNSIPLGSWPFGGGDSRTENYGYLRLTFTADTIATNTGAAPQVAELYLVGTTYWTVPSTYALTGDIYSYDWQQNVVFPGKVTAKGGFVGNADSATKATNDSAGNNISTTYLKKTDSAASATKLSTARTIQTNLGSTTAGSFDGSANVEPGVKGTLPVANGGTGATDAAGARKNLGLGSLATKSSVTKSDVGLGNVDNTADKDKLVNGLVVTNASNYSINVKAAPYYNFDDLGTKDYSEFFKLYLKKLASNHADLVGCPISGCVQPATVVNVYGYLYNPLSADSNGLPQHSFFHVFGYNKYEAIFGTVDHEYYYKELDVNVENRLRRYKVYFNTNGKYLKLGTLHTSQVGNYCLVRICYGSGYNARLDQDQSQTIHFRTGNGTGDSYNAYVVNENPNCTNPYPVYINKISNTEYEFWTDKLNYTGNSFAVFECSSNDTVDYTNWQTGSDSLPSTVWKVTVGGGPKPSIKTISGNVNLSEFYVRSNNYAIRSWSKDYTSEGIDANTVAVVTCIISPTEQSKQAVVQGYLEYGWLNIRIVDTGFSTNDSDITVNYTINILN